MKDETSPVIDLIHEVDDVNQLFVQAGRFSVASSAEFAPKIDSAELLAWIQAANETLAELLPKNDATEVVIDPEWVRGNRVELGGEKYGSYIGAFDLYLRSRAHSRNPISRSITPNERAAANDLFDADSFDDVNVRFSDRIQDWTWKDKRQK